MFYNHQEIEKKWQKFWEENQTYKTENNSTKPKFYVLDMFPLSFWSGFIRRSPSGYIASIFMQGSRDIKVLTFCILSVMILSVCQQNNMRFKLGNILDYYRTKYYQIRRANRKIGFSFDWSREVRTSDASYYKWTQWIL